MGLLKPCLQVACEDWVPCPCEQCFLEQGCALDPMSGTGLWLSRAAREHSSLAIRPLE